MKSMFEIYDFIITTDTEVHYIENEKGQDNQILVFIAPPNYSEIATILVKNFSNFLSDKYEATIISDGTVVIDLMPLIDHYCMIEDAEIWDTRYKQIGGY